MLFAALLNKEETMKKGGWTEFFKGAARILLEASAADYIRSAIWVWFVANYVGWSVAAAIVKKAWTAPYA